MGHVLAVVSQKGGVGKTTTVVNLAAAFARRGLRTTVVDVDPQGAVAYGVGLPTGQAAPGIAEFLAGSATLEAIQQQTIIPWLRVVLAGHVVEAGDHGDYLRQLASADGGLASLLGTLAAQSDVVVVDTPPGLGPLVRRVLAASGHVLVPLQCEPLALQTTPQILRGIQEASSANPELTLDGIVLTMYDAASPLSARVAEYVRQNLPSDLVLETAIPRSPGPAEAFAAGQPLVLRDPADPAAEAYNALAGTLAERFR